MAVIIGVSFGIKFALEKTIASFESSTSALQAEQQALQKELDDLKQNKGKLDIYTASKRLVENMTSTISYYSAIGVDIPQKVWLNTFYADDNGSFAIKGETVSVDDVYLFFRGLKSQVPNSSLVLSKLGIKDENAYVDIEQATDLIYTFELTNSNYVNAITKAAEAAAAAAAGVDANGNPLPVDPNAPADGGIPKIQDLPTLQ